MKNGSMLFLLLFSCQALLAQFQVGVRGGTNFSKQRYYFDDEFSGTFAAINGFDIGVLGVMGIKNKFELKTELGLVQKGGKVPGDFLVVVNELELAALAIYKITSNNSYMYIGYGGFVGYGLSGYTRNLDINNSDKHEIDFNSNAYVINRNSAGMLGAFGVGVQVKNGNIFLEGRYRYTMTFFQDQMFENFKLSNKNIGFGIHLGYVHNLKNS